VQKARLVTEEFRPSPEANIEERLRIALFHASRRGWIGEFSVRMPWVSLRASGFGFEDRSMKLEVLYAPLCSSVSFDGLGEDILAFQRPASVASK
jgi:hypothetical protein